MGKIHIEFDTEYEKGDLVIFKKNNRLMVGLVEGYYVDEGANNSIWYNIRVSKDFVYTYTSEGDIAEYDILQKIEESEKVRNFIISGNEY